MRLCAGGIQEAGPSQPAATQAEEEAQGFESAQEEMTQAQGPEPVQEAMTQPAAPLAADSNQSKVRATRGRGQGRSRGRGGASSSRPATDRKSHASAVHGDTHSFKCLIVCFAWQSCYCMDQTACIKLPWANCCGLKRDSPGRKQFLKILNVVLPSRGYFVC